MSKPKPAPPPKEYEAHVGEASATGNLSAVTNVYDPMARMGDGSACPFSSWPRTGDPRFDRRSFAAAFIGLSGSFHNPASHDAKNSARPILRIFIGGAWIWTVQGEVKPDSPLGPAIDAEGKPIPGVLETVPADEAIAKAVAADGPLWKVKMFTRPGTV